MVASRLSIFYDSSLGASWLLLDHTLCGHPHHLRGCIVVDRTLCGLEPLTCVRNVVDRSEVDRSPQCGAAMWKIPADLMPDLMP
jgi:hypothetical protein